MSALLLLLVAGFRLHPGTGQTAQQTAFHERASDAAGEAADVDVGRAAV